MVAINHYERTILTVLLRYGRWLNTTEIANASKMSWNTAYKYLLKLNKRGWISKKGNYWLARR